MDKISLDSLFVKACRAHFNCASELFAPLDLQRSWPAVLQELECEAGLDQTELARRLEVTTATMTNLLVRMQSAGLIERCRDRKDSRISKVYLTELGQTKLEAVKQTLEQIESVTFAGFSGEEKHELKAYLDRMHANLLAQR